MTTATETMITKGNRTWIMKPDERTFPAVAAELVARGYDPVYYFGTSEPQGRQRIRKHAIARRVTATGQFIFDAEVNGRR